MKEKLHSIIKELQSRGLPLFFVQDPVTRLPSVSLTLLIVSFTLAILSLLNKVANIVDGVDVENTLELLIITASLYFGRAFTRGSTGSSLDTSKKGE
jgi:hypothetical protein